MRDQLLTLPGTVSRGPHAAAAGEPDRSRLGAAPAELLGAGLDELVAASYAQLQPASDDGARRRRRSVAHLLRWLSRFRGDSWMVSGLDAGGTSWPNETDHNRRGLLFKGARTLICLGVILPDYPWLLDTSFAWLFTAYRRANDPGAFDKLEQAARSCAQPAPASRPSRRRSPFPPVTSRPSHPRGSQSGRGR
jgi:hypothetical protein